MSDPLGAQANGRAAGGPGAALADAADAPVGRAPLVARRVGIRNPPGLAQISYRVGTYGTFLAGMLARLRTGTIDDPALPAPLAPLANLDLETRHDWVWSLLDAWAVVGDVLTFYQERIANEGYLGTAVEERSVRWLAQLVGYRPAPGIAGTADLAFNVLTGRRLPTTVDVPARTAVRSMPIGNALPQIFEIPQALLARAAWNAIRPVAETATEPQRIGSGESQLLLAGRVVLKPGTPLLVAVMGGDGATRMSLRTVGSAAAQRATIGGMSGASSVTAGAAAALAAARGSSGGAAAESTLVTLDPIPGEPAPAGVVQQVFQLLRRDHLFGYNAPQWSTLPDPVKQKYSPRKGGVAASGDRGASWRALDSGLPTTAVSALAYDASGELVAGTAAGFFRWTGDAWKAPTSGLGKTDVRAIAISPAGHLYAGTAQGIYRSLDGGDTWSNLTAVARSPKRGLVIALASRSVAVLREVLHRSEPQAQPRLPSTALQALLATGDASGTALYAATGQGIFRSDETGGGWLPVNTGLPKADPSTGLASLVVQALAALPSGEILAGTEQGVFVTRDRGRRWEAASSGLPRIQSGNGGQAAVGPVAALAAAADARQGTSQLFAATVRGVFRSDDAGASWRSASAGLPTGSGSARDTPAAVSVLALAADARTLATYLFAATAQGLFRSDDLGGSWREVEEAPEGTITALAGSSQGVAVATPFDGFVDSNWPGFQLQNGDIDLSTVDTSVVPESWVVLQQSRTQPAPLPPLPPRIGIYAAETVNTVARSGFGTTAQVTRIGVQDDGQLGLFDLRLTDALVDSAALPLAQVSVVQPMSQTLVEVDLPATEAPPAGARVAVAGKPIRARLEDGESVQVLAMPVPGTSGSPGGLWTVRDASGALRTLPVNAATVAWEPAQADDLGAAEVVAVSPGTLPDNATTPNAVLAFNPALTTPFDPATVQIQANVAPATQGETVPREVLGSGDATKPFQRFTLTRKPLTYVPTALGGYRSTLQVRVGDVLWTEVQSLAEQQPSSRVYTVILDVAGQATVVFGDGVHGARLPTGVENVVATYRTGLWTSQVMAGSLSLLQQRPYGLRGAANPQATEPGVPPEGRDDIRERVPMSLRTLDRVVSLADYLDFARTYPGVGKAAVDPLWTGAARLAAVTAAGLDGKPLSSALCTRLARALQAKAAPGQAAAVFPYRPAFFAVGASLILQADLPPDTTPHDVLDAARSALLDAFGAARRSFGQGVAASEVTTVLQKVEGVAAVDLLTFHRKDHPKRQPAAFLSSAPAHWEWRHGQVAPAELLLVDPSSIDLRAEGGA